MADSSGKSIKEKQHALYDEELQLIEAGVRDAVPFVPRSEFGQLMPSAKLQKRFAFA